MAPEAAAGPAPPEASRYTLKYSSNNGRTWKLIDKYASGFPYSWDAPKLTKNKKNCLIKAVAFNGGKKLGSDVSGKFTIGTVMILDPSAESEWTGGDDEIISWRTYGTKRRVNKAVLKYTKNGGKTWTKILPGPAPFDPWAHVWDVPVPGNVKEECRVKLLLKDKNGNIVGQDDSNGWFTMSPP
jgi:hypothetical protein